MCRAGVPEEVGLTTLLHPLTKRGYPAVIVVTSTLSPEQGKMRCHVRAIYSFGQAEELYLETGARSAWALDSGSGSGSSFR